jgi:hypothetical protein
MSDDNRLDEKISGLVRSVDRGLPPLLEERIRAAATAGRARPGVFGWRPARLAPSARRRTWMLALVPGAAAAVILAVFLLIPALSKPAAPRVSEIRTEFEIADKNIKIVFFQRPDFKLTQEE